MISKEQLIKSIQEKKELDTYETVISVIGTGGAGNNTISNLKKKNPSGIKAIAINTDAQDLLYSHAHKKILIGEDVTHGLGAGSNPALGEEAAKESEQEIKEAITGSDMVFVTCGLGGGTGTGAAPIIAAIAQKIGALTVAIVTMPFSVEGKKRWMNAEQGLEKLRTVTDTVIVIPNDKLLEVAPTMPIQLAFKVADEILMNSVKGITELITKPGLVNLDFADVRAVMSNGGVAMIGVGESNTEKRAIESVEEALSSPLLDVDITGAKGALINICGGPDLTIEECDKILQTVSSKLDPEANIIWGAHMEEEMEKTIRTMLVVTGVKSPQILGKTTPSDARMKLSQDLGIDFIE